MENASRFEMRQQESGGYPESAGDRLSWLKIASGAANTTIRKLAVVAIDNESKEA